MRPSVITCDKAEKSTLGIPANIKVRPSARSKINGKVGCVVREVVLVHTSPVPESHENDVRNAAITRNIVYGHRARRSIPRIDRVAAIMSPVCAVHEL